MSIQDLKTKIKQELLDEHDYNEQCREGIDQDTVKTEIVNETYAWPDDLHSITFQPLKSEESQKKQSEFASFSKQSDAQSCIIIHPGSRYLRIGRPSDSAPHTVLHAIACKKRGNGPLYCDSFVSPAVKLDKHAAHEIEDCRLNVSHILQSSFTSEGSRRFATTPQQVSAFNKRSHALRTEDDPSDDPLWTEPTEDFIVGDEILTLKPGLDYNIHFPYKKGDLNIHSNIGGSITAVMSHLRIIWEFCITNLLNIALKDILNFKAVLVIPDVYNRDYVKNLTNLLLTDIGFGGCFVIQDHVAATFGAGFGAACVVDVGDQKTSISCVEDGISHPATRLRLDYGGSDISQIFHWLIRKCSFPYQFNLADKKDYVLLNELKRDFCHINLDVCGPQEKEFSVGNPGEKHYRYKVQMGDELIIAPLSYFYPDLLMITGPKSATTQKANEGDSEDPLDEFFLRETTKLRGREVSEPLEMDVTEDDVVIEEQSPSSAVQSSGATKETFSATLEKLLSLEQAVLASIDQCSNEELKRKMYTSVLVVGGGAKFDQFGKWLQNRLALLIPLAYRSEQIEVTTKPKDLDPSTTVWKGASLMTCLEGSSELWIDRNEWAKQGMKILREKCPFIW